MINKANKIGNMDKKRGGKKQAIFAPFNIALIILISIISFIFLVSALTDDERASLQSELDNLISDLNSQGYSWLTDYSINYPFVEVYREGDNQSIANFGNIFSEGWYKIYLTNLSDNETRDVFDLRIISGEGNLSGSFRGVEFDYIVDPVNLTFGTSLGTGYITNGNNVTITANASTDVAGGNVSTFINFDGSLVSWWRMDDTNGSANSVTDYMGRNNGTAVGQASQTDAGYMGKGEVFDGDGDRITIAGTYSSPNNYTYSFWINPNSNTGFKRIFVGSVNADFSLQAGAIYLAGGSAMSTASITTGEWQHIIIICNASSAPTYVYRNGVDISAGLSGVCSASIANPIIGDRAALDRGFNGSMDDVMIFNRSLSAHEIQMLYANSSSKYLSQNYVMTDERNYSFTAYAQDTAGSVNSSGAITITRDITNPTLNITYPQNTTYTNYVIALNYTSSGASNCWYSINSGTFNYSSVSAGTNWTGLSGNSSKGSNTWTLWCNDTAGNLNSTSVTFVVDNTVPTQIINSPTNTTYTTSNINFNITSSESGTGSIIPNLDSSLVSWWRMDDTNGSSNSVSDYLGRNNGTAQGGAVQIDAGYFGKGESFDGNGDYVSMSDVNYPNTTFTISAWFNSKNLTSGISQIIWAGDTPTAERIRFYTNIAGTLQFIDDYGVSVAGGVLTENAWYHAAITYDYNLQIVSLYLNGNNLVNDTSFTQAAFSSANFWIGMRTGSTYPFNGTIDDVMIFNRSLTSDEIIALYNATAINHNSTLAEGSHSLTAYSQDRAGNINNSAVTFSVDSVAPTLNITYPQNTTYTNYVIALNYTSSGASNCWYSINSGTFNYTSVSAGTNWTGLNGNSSKGSNTWTLWCNDSAGNLNSTSVTFVVDTTVPTQTINSPTNTTYTTSNINFNITSSESGTGSLVPNLDSSLVSWWRMDDTNGSSNSVSDYMGRNNGTAVGNAVQTDSGYMGKGEGFDGVDDSITYSSVNLSNVNFTVVSWVYPTSLDSQNTIINVRPGEVSTALISGKFKVLTNNDAWKSSVASVSLNNWNFVVWVFNGTTDLIYINGTLDTTLVDNVADSAGILDIGSVTTTAFEFNGTIDDVMIFNRSLSADEIIALYNATAIYHTSVLAEGSHSLTAYSQDLAGNVNNSAVSFGVDTTFPTLNITYPLNTTYTNYVTALNYTSSGASSCWYGNGSINYTSVSAGTNWTGLSGNSTKGSNTWTLWCNDTANNVNSTSVTFVVDNTSPTQTIFSPTNTTYTTSNINFNVSSSEVGTGSLVPNLDSSLVSWWRMDDTNGSSNSVSDYMGRNNGTAVGNAVQTDAGYFGKGEGFDGNGDYVIYADTPSLNITGNQITLNAWVNMNLITSNGYNTIISKESSTSGAGGYGLNLDWGQFEFILNSNDTEKARAFSASIGVWYMVTGVFNGTNILLYVNGTQKANVAKSISINSLSSVLDLGMKPGAARYFNGTIDDVMIFNRSLSSDEITALYNATAINHNSTIGEGSHSLTAYSQDLAGNINNSAVSFGIDTTFPTLNITYPTNTTHTNYVTILNYTSTGASSCWYSINSGTFNYTSVSAGTNWTGLNGNSSKGSNTWTLWCNDTANNINSTSVTFVVDNVNPLISYGSGTETDGSNLSRNNIFVNVSSSDSVGNVSTFINFDGSLVSWWRMDDTNGSANSVTDYMGRNNGTAVGQASQTDAGYMGKGESFDGSGDYVDIVGGSELDNAINYTISFWVKPASPNDTIVDVLQKGTRYNYNGAINVELNSGLVRGRVSNISGSAFSIYAINQAGAVQNNWYHIVLVISNTTAIGYSNGIAGATASITGGVYPLQSYSAGNLGTHLAFGCELRNTGCVDYFNGSIDDVMIFNRSLSALEIAGLYANTSSKYLSVNYTGLSDATHTFKAYTQDLGGNVNNSLETRSVTTDTTYPTLNITYPLNTTYTNYVTALNYTSSGASSCWYGNGSINYTSVSAGTNWTGLSGNSSKGSNTWTLWCNDTAGNLNSTSVTFVVDNINPLISYGDGTETDGSNLSRNNIFVNISSSDTTSNISTVINLDGSLVSWWRMDDTNGSSNSVSDYLGRNNGTAQGGAVQIDAGYFGKGESFDGNGDYVQTPQFTPLVGALTVCLWTKANNITDRGMFGWANTYNGGTDDRIIYTNTANKPIFYVFNSGAQQATGTTTLQNNVWYHLCGTIDTILGNSIWVNGINESIDSGGTNGYNGYGAAFVFIGAKFDASGWGNYDFNGTIDDVMIFNRSLSANEIAGLYANTSSKYLSVNYTGLSDATHTFKAYTQDMAGNVNNSLGTRSVTTDTGVPVVNITYPTNTTYNINVSAINYTSDGVNCWYSLNLGVTNSSSVSCGTNWTGLISSEGSNTWKVYVNDSAGNQNVSSITFFKDTTYPTWTGNKTNLTSATPVGQSVYFNITLTETNPSAYIFSWYNGTAWENTTASYTNAQEVFVIKTINSDTGTINWTWYINDTANNINQTTIWSISLSADDATAPNVTINYPLSTNYSASSFNFNITAVDNIAMSSCWMTLNNGVTNYTMTNTTSVNDYNYTNSSIADGSYTANFYCNDTNNNVNGSMSVGFSVDTTYPTLNIVYPVNGTIYSINVSALNYTSSGASNCWYSTNNGATNSTSVSAGTNFTGLSGVNDKNNWTVYCNDSAGNTNSSLVTFYSTYVSACGSLTQANQTYTLQNSITTTGTCFNITASNITINGNGYTLIGDGGASDYGITTSANSNLKNITIKNFGNIGTFGRGIYLDQVNNSLIYNNTMISQVAQTTFAIYLEDGAFNLVDNNNINWNATDSVRSSYGIYLYANFGKTAGNNNITGNNLTIYSASSSGLGVYFDNYGTSNSNIIYNSIINVYSNQSVNGFRSYGLILANVDNSNFSSLRINATAPNAHEIDIYIATGSSGNVFYDNNLIGSNWSSYIANSGGTNNTFTNVSYLGGEFVGTGTAELTRKWYYQAKVNDTSGNAVVANVSATNSSGSLQFSVMTNSSGWIASPQIITDYVNTAGTKTYYSLYTINATNSSYPTKSVSYNVTSSQNNLAHNLMMDNDYPLISFGTGTESNGSTITRNNIYVNVSVTEDNENTIVFNLYYSNNTLVNSSSYTNQQRTINWTGLSDNSYKFNVSVNDSVNKVNSTATRSVTLDLTTVTNCRSLNQSNTIYTLQNSITTTGTCLTIGANNITINLNGFSMTGDGNSQSDYGINNSGSYTNLTIKNGSIYNFGIGIWNKGSYGNFIDLNITIVANIIGGSTDVYGISLTSGNNSYVGNNNINVSLSGSGGGPWNAYGISISDSSTNTINDTRINSVNGVSSGYGIYIATSSINNTIVDSNISGSTTKDVYLNYLSTNNIFLNATYSGSEYVGTSSQLIRKWYYTAYVNDTSGNAVVANVSATNSSGSVEFSVMTNSSGWTTQQQITDYVNNAGTISYYSLYTINATNSSYPTKSVSYNVTSSQNNLAHNLMMDNDYPLISFGTGTESNGSTITRNNIYVNVSVTEDNENTIVFNLYYSNGTLVNSSSYTNQQRTINWTGLFDNTYKFNVSVNDSVNKVNSTATRSVTLDLTSVTNCRTLNQTNAVYTLQNSMSTTGDCLVVSANNITINMNGKAITGDGNSENDYGIDNSGGYHNLSVRNGTIGSLSGSDFGVGIYSTGNLGNFTDLKIQALISVSGNFNLYGVYFSGDNNFLKNVSALVTLSKADDVSFTTYGISILGDNNLIDDSSFSATSLEVLGIGTSTSYSISLSTASNNNISDTTFSSSSADTKYDVYLNSGSNNNIFLNTTYNVSKELIIVGSLTRKWYYTAYVNDSNTGSALSEINITAYNSSSNYQFNLTTGSDGLTTSSAQIIDYINNAGTKTYYSNYNIYAGNATYPTMLNTWNVTAQQNTRQTITLDNVYPQISIAYPTNTTYGINVSAINYTYTEINCNRVWYSTNNGVTNSSSVSCGTNFTSVISSEGSNTWIVYINDSANNINSSSVTFTKDTTTPIITITSPLNQTYNTNSILINFTADSYSSLWYYNGTANRSYTSSETITTSQGSNAFIFYANDTAGNLNSTSRTFFVDSVYPLVNIVSPANNTNSSDTNLNINYSVSDTNLGSCWWTNNSGATNNSIVCGTNITAQIWSQGNNNIVIYVNDSAGNINSSSVSFLIDSIYPLISFGTGTSDDNANVSRNNVYVNTTWTETNLANITFSLYNDTSTVNQTTYTTATYLINWTSLADNNYTYEVNITDTANNKNSTGIRNIRLDTIKPLISYGDGTADDLNRTSTKTNVYVNVSLTETNFKNITFNLYYSNNTAVNTTTYTTDTRTINWTSLAGDDYKYNVSVYDTAGNTNSTATRSITLITSQNNITLNSGWNLIALPMHNTDTGTDRNISLVAGWNLIGYTGDINLSLADAVFNNGSNSYTWANAVANNKVQAYLSYYDNNAQDNLTTFKYLSTISDMDDTMFRQNKGYWVYANNSGNLTIPAVGGTMSGESYSWGKLRFMNSSGVEKNITDAATANWIVMTLQYSDTGNGAFKLISSQSEVDDLAADISYIPAFKGIFVYSYYDNITMIREN